MCASPLTFLGLPLSMVVVVMFLQLCLSMPAQAQPDWVLPWCDAYAAVMTCLTVPESHTMLHPDM